MALWDLMFILLEFVLAFVSFFFMPLQKFILCYCILKVFNAVCISKGNHGEEFVLNLRKLGLALFGSVETIRMLATLRDGINEF